MRIGTWNLAGRWSAEHESLMVEQDCDTWLLTEVSDRMDLVGMVRHRSDAFMAPRRHWSAILSRHSIEPLPDPHPATTAALWEGRTLVSSVLPWRSCGARFPWVGTSHGEKTRAAVAAIAHRLRGPVIWGGDWNHAMHGPEHAGSKGGRAHVLEAVSQLGLRVATARLPHRIDDLLSIDHIAVPEGTVIESAQRVVAARQGKRLSDHDAYVVTIGELAL